MLRNQPKDYFLLNELHNAYLEDPNSPLDLPTNKEVHIALFDQIKQEILDLCHKSDFTKAEALVNLAWQIARQIGDRDLMAQANWCSGLFYLNRDIQSSIYHLKEAIEHFRCTQQVYNEGRTLIGYAGQLNVLGKFDAAEEAINRAIKCLEDWPEYHDWPVVYINRSYTLGNKSLYSEAIESTRSAEYLTQVLSQTYPEKFDHYQKQRIQTLINRGWISILCNDVMLAQESLHKAIEIARPQKAYLLLGLAYLNLARFHTLQSNLFEAFKMLQLARQNFEIAQCKSEQAMTLQYEADLYRQLRMPRHARSTTVRAAHIFSERELAVDCVEAYIAAVDIALAQRKTKLARKYLEASQPLLEQTSPYLQYLWKSYHAHPALQQTEQQREQALYTIQQASGQLTQLGATQPALQTRLLGVRLAADLHKEGVVEQCQQIIDEAHQHGIFQIEQESCIELACLQEGEAAEKALRRAADMLVRARQTMPIEEFKANLLTGQMDIYVQLIEAQRQNQKEIPAAETLLEAKGGIWADFATLSAIPEQREPDEAWVRARAELSYWQSELQLTRQENNPNYATYLATCEMKIEQAKSAVSAASRANARFVQKQQNVFFATLPSILDIQKMLQEQEQRTNRHAFIVDYLVGANIIHGCIISANQIEWVELGQVAEVQQLMFQLGMLLDEILSRKNVADQQTFATTQKSITDQLLAQLYQQLFLPIEAYLTEQDLDSDIVMIAPDQFLFSVPWSALYSGAEYLGERYLLEIYPSALSPMLNQDPLQREQAKNALLLGYPGHQNPLVHLEKELNAIQAELPQAKMIYPAGKTDFEWVSSPGCLHIAAHGLLDAQAPLFSGLEMEDETLLLADVFNLNLQGTALVTLSACQTGVTPDQGGIVLALAGAFLCAGAQTILSSLWSVDDEATQLLMTAFYQAWQEGHTIAAALQKAQTQLRAVGFTHPFYWAAFQPLSR